MRLILPLFSSACLFIDASRRRLVTAGTLARPRAADRHWLALHSLVLTGDAATVLEPALGEGATEALDRCWPLNVAEEVDISAWRGAKGAWENRTAGSPWLIRQAERT